MTKQGKHSSWVGGRKYVGCHGVKERADDDGGEVGGGKVETGGACDSFGRGCVNIYVFVVV